MTTVALRGLFGRKLRTVLSSLAIVLGVALISGSLVLTDSIDRAFHSIFSGAYEHTDAVVSARNPLDWSSTTPTVPASLVQEIRALPGVATATGSIVDFNGDSDTAKIIGKDGEPITGSGNPTFGFGIDGSAARFSPLDLVEGRWARGSGEVVVDAATADAQGFRIGDRVAVAVDEKRWYRLAGIAGFGGVSSIGGATVAVWDVATAQKLLHKPGRVDTIAVAAKPDVSRAELIEQVRSVLPASAQVRTSEAQAQEDGKGVQMFVQVIRWFLLGFGAVALFVGSFVIFNTLSITVAQRTRELGTLRSLGGSRRQVLRSVLLEALAIGALASVLGLGLGVALAHGLKRLFAALSLDLPSASMTLEPTAVVVSLLAGILLTVVAGVVPARRATRVAPIAAMRDGAAAAGTRRSRSSIVGAGLLVAAVALLGAGLFAHGIDAAPRTFALLGGVLFLFLGTALVASRLVKPLVAIVGAPSRRLGGVAGRLAVENAHRNPSRTAATAAALMVGLALVTFVTAFGKGLSDSDLDSLKAQVRSPFVVTSQSGWGSFSAATEAALAKAQGVRTVSGVRFDRARAAGANASVNGIDPQTIGGLIGFEWRSGPPDAATTLTASEALVKQSFAKDNALAVGDRFELTTPSGVTKSLRVKAIFETPKLESVIGGIVLSQQTFDRIFPRPRDAFVLVDGETSAASLQRALGGFADAKAATRDDWAATRANGFTQVLNLLYVLLALSVLVSLFGMVNTLALSVFERTRELGMLRAVGMTRRQARRMIRHESVVTALIGAALGIPLGLGLAAAAAAALSKYGIAFTVPPRVLVFVAIAIGAGLAAALLPARRASRLNVLRALQYE